MINEVFSSKINYQKHFRDYVNPISTNPTKWSNTLKQFVGCCPRIGSVCLTILQGWCLRDKLEYLITFKRLTLRNRFLQNFAHMF